MYNDSIKTEAVMSMMTRRTMLLLGGVAAVWPMPVDAQQPSKVHRIFWASTESQPDPFVDGFRDGLQERGYIEGKNVALSLRYSPGIPTLCAR